MWHRYSLSSFCSALWDSWASGSLKINRSLKKKLKPAFGSGLSVTMRLLLGCRLFCSRGWRRKQCPGAKRQQRHWQTGKNRPVLALADGETRRCREQGANKGAVSPGKSGLCWRDRMKKQDVAGSEAPTWAPSAWENLDPVGVPG